MHLGTLVPAPLQLIVLPPVQCAPNGDIAKAEQGGVPPTKIAQPVTPYARSGDTASAPPTGLEVQPAMDKAEVDMGVEVGEIHSICGGNINLYSY